MYFGGCWNCTHIAQLLELHTYHLRAQKGKGRSKI
jgi:hypothetical protein